MKNTKIKTKQLIYELILSITAVLSVIFLWQNNIGTFTILTILWILAMFLWHKKIDIITFIVGAIIGPIVEVSCIAMGVWSYANPSFIGIPLWLPILWGLATVLTRRIAETIFIITNEKNKKH